MFDALRQDVRYACRHLRRSPGFAVAAILTLSVGIGANAAVFTVLNTLVIKRLPIHDPDGLISVSGRNARGQIRVTPIPAIRELARDGPLQDLCGYNGGFITSVAAHGVSTEILGAIVTGRCFSTLGVTPILGRAILDDDAPLDHAGQRVVVIGHRFWTRMFGADPRAIGQTISADGADLTVIGVLPPGFEGLHVDSGTDLYAPPDTIFPVGALGRRPGASQILGRLRPGVSLEQATAQLQTRWPALLDAVVPPTLPAVERADLRAARPDVQRLGTGLSVYRDRYVRPLGMILGLTSLLLVLTCVNLGGLLLARLAARRSELSVRLALGASRTRIAQQMLVEGVILSICGAVLAVPISFLFVAPLVSLIPPGLVPRTVLFAPDLRVVSATSFVGVAAGVLISALPIGVALRRHAHAEFAWDRTIAGSTSRWARGLLVAQVALSVVLVIGAGLLTRSLYRLQQGDLGVRTAGVLTVRVMAVANGYRGIDNASYYPTLLNRIAALPGVRSVGFARLFPNQIADTPGDPIGFVGDAEGNVMARMDTTSPGFFETVGIPLRRGRFLSWSDGPGRRQVALVNEHLAYALAPDGDVLERHVRLGSIRGNQDVVIVGVVGNATLGNPRQSDPSVFYRPALQSGANGLYPTLVIATHGDTAAVGAGVTRILNDGGREFAHEIVSLEDVIKRAPSSERMSATLAGVVGAIALLLAVIGIHSALAYAVSRRTREIGVRVAIGAAPSAVARIVIREGVVVTLIGLAIGLPLALLAARALSTLLFGISENDLVTFAATAAFFSAIGVAVSVIPAWRAVRIDPVVALRAE